MFNYSDRMANMNGSATREIFKLLANPEIISFAGGLPATQCLPIAEVQKITNDILHSDKATSILQYGTTEGYVSLRKLLIEYVSAVGIHNIDIDNTLIISGGQQGIDLACKAFLNKGDVVLVEDPTYLAFLQIINSYEATCVGVKADNNGLDLDDLENKIIQLKPKMIYCVPTFSNPTGKTYTTANRKAIICLAAKYNVLVVEDDPYSKLRFEGEAVPSIKSFDQSGHVVYLTSFSKIISPGLRIGVAIGDKEVIRKMAICKQGTDLHTSNLSQMIVEEYLKQGYLYPNIEKNLPIYLEKKTAMMNAISQYMPDEFIHTNPQGGLFIWGSLPEYINTVELFPQAIELKVAYIIGSVFFANGGGLSTLRLNFSNASLEQIDRGISTLGRLIQSKIL